MRKLHKFMSMGLALAMAASMLTACGGSAGGNTGNSDKVDASAVTFPLEETVTITGMTKYPVATEPEPNNRTIFKRLEEETNVHIDWTAISSDQWGDKIQLEMANAKTLPEFVFDAGFGEADLLKYGKNGVIIPLEEYITPEIMPNLCKVFEQAPEYEAMCKDVDGHIWALPWIEQLGYQKTAIQLLDNMPFINTAWLDFLGLEMPGTVEEFEAVLKAFKDNAADLQAEFNIEGDIIPMSCIMNDGGQDPYILINSFGEGYGDPDTWKHLVVTNDGKVVSDATSEGFKEGTAWLHDLYAQGLIDAEAFTQDWSTYVAKGKSGRYGVCFSWDIANIAPSLEGWAPLPILAKDGQKCITPDTAAYTSGYNRGRCVVTATAQNPALICKWLDMMYAPLQSPQNNWGTYGEDDEFDIFEMGTNDAGEPMLKHAPLGDASPVEVREAESVNGPLAILDSYYGKYVTLPDDAAYRLEWIEEIYAPDCDKTYCLPNFFMTQEDTVTDSNLSADLGKCVNEFKSRAVMDGFTDADWDQFQANLKAYGLDEYVALYQKYFDALQAAQ